MEKKLHKMIFTCGGTAGHINPAIALAQLAREKEPTVEILFVGAERGLEKDLVPKAGYHFRTVHISSFHRSFKPHEIKHNLMQSAALPPGSPGNPSGISARCGNRDWRLRFLSTGKGGGQSGNPHRGP